MGLQLSDAGRLGAMSRGSELYLGRRIKRRKQFILSYQALAVLLVVLGGGVITGAIWAPALLGSEAFKFVFPVFGSFIGSGIAWPVRQMRSLIESLDDLNELARRYEAGDEAYRKQVDGELDRILQKGLVR